MRCRFSELSVAKYAEKLIDSKFTAGICPPRFDHDGREHENRREQNHAPVGHPKQICRLDTVVQQIAASVLHKKRPVLPPTFHSARYLDAISLRRSSLALP